jgi:hypothetical protein
VTVSPQVDRVFTWRVAEDMGFEPMIGYHPKPA